MTGLTFFAWSWTRRTFLGKKLSPKYSMKKKVLCKNSVPENDLEKFPHFFPLKLLFDGSKWLLMIESGVEQKSTDRESK